MRDGVEEMQQALNVNRMTALEEQRVIRLQFLVLGGVVKRGEVINFLRLHTLEQRENVVAFENVGPISARQADHGHAVQQEQFGKVGTILPTRADNDGGFHARKKAALKRPHSKR